MCVRNTFLEELHQGPGPQSATGDYTDVKIIDAEGEIPWNEVSRLNDDEIRRLMKQVVNRLYTFFLKNDDPYFAESIQRWAAAAEQWDDPEPDEVFLRMIAQNQNSSSDKKDN